MRACFFDTQTTQRCFSTEIHALKICLELTISYLPYSRCAKQVNHYEIYNFYSTIMPTVAITLCWLCDPKNCQHSIYWFVKNTGATCSLAVANKPVGLSWDKDQMPLTAWEKDLLSSQCQSQQRKCSQGIEIHCHACLRLLFTFKCLAGRRHQEKAWQGNVAK